MAEREEHRLILITGGSASGKSHLAEQYACRTAEEAGLSKLYLAAMEVRDEEMARKVLRHQQRRAEQGWQTIECPVDISRAAADQINFMASEDQADFKTTADWAAGRTTREQFRYIGLALLECMSNLTANEMFRDGMIFPAGETAEKILSDIRSLRQQFRILFIVTNEVFSDGAQYDKGTMEYLRAMGQINTMLASEADEVYEAVAGIPVRWK